MDWWQFAGFVEGGRVAGEYTFSELTSDWKADAGIGIRAMVAGGVVRFDVAASSEGLGFRVMVGQPF
jgi:outer membrane translocation and assembly module TamA